MQNMSITFMAISGALSILLIAFILAVYFRRVVPTNEEHIVQSAKRTTSYGKNTNNGNTYYEWPSFLPIIGVSTIVLPVSVFNIDLENYEAYDIGRLPFVVDITAFFRIEDSSLSAARVSSFEELKEQLQSIVQGSVRSILASSDIEKIMQDRSEFGEHFTRQVESNITSWGLVVVKNIELMDIRDARDSHVIANIMEKKKSMIERESRVEVAKNMQEAEIAEVNAQRETELKRQEAEQAVGIRTAEKDKAVGVAKELALQEIKDQAKTTAEKDVLVKAATEVGQARINKDVEVVKAEQDKQTTVLVAEGKLEATKLESDGIKVEGVAKAAAETAILLAPVEAQVKLAKEINSNPLYLQYLVSIKGVEAMQVVGVSQAEALKESDLKVIVNSGETTAGVSKIMDIFSSHGGTGIASMLEAIAQGEGGKALLERFGVKLDGTQTVASDKDITADVTTVGTGDGLPKNAQQY